MNEGDPCLVCSAVAFEEELLFANGGGMQQYCKRQLILCAQI